MRSQPRSFGDGGGVTRRDHAVRTANEANAGAGGLSAIDSVLGEVSKSRVGKVDHIGNLFRTMDMQPDDTMDLRTERAEGLAKVVAHDPYPVGQEPLGLNRSGRDPYSVVNDPNYYDQETRYDSSATPEAAMRAGGNKSNVGFESGGLNRAMWTHNNLDAAAYHLESVGTPVKMTNNWHEGEGNSNRLITGINKTDTGSLDPERVDYNVHTTEGMIRVFPNARNPKQTWR